MRAVLAGDRDLKRVDAQWCSPFVAGTDWMMLGLTGATLANHIGGMIQGYPLLTAMLYGDMLMYFALMGVGLALVAAISAVAIVGMKRTNPRYIEYDEPKTSRRRRRH
eukprot:Gregarina_sp_Poly_1__286@NODE_1070_length_5185_cov_83_065260_g743_i0_p5_GENE_NODE_1070_length_5185_cov_83_065260_g743_i0NODE_1070_length_5185_cov_83_065260_g743_i0_p5_ORF_typecomplete_len108_score10_19VirB8/PF04335_13/0_1_NODE_1070_length_5185_cov_83_065260_g743_i08021125